MLRIHWNDVPRLLVNIILIVSTVVVALLRARNVKEGLWLSAATGGAIAALLGKRGTVLMFVARRVVRRRGGRTSSGKGLANICRPANQTRAVVLSLGFGAFTITTLYLVQYNLLHNLAINGSASGAGMLSFFHGDAGWSGAASLDSMIRKRGYRIVQQAPVVPMRIAAINGESVYGLTGGHR